MEAELKEFEEKINSITEQFMSLLDSNDVIESTVNTNFKNTSEISNGGHCNINCNEPTEESIFKLKADNINIGGIAYGNEVHLDTKIPTHAIKFDSVGQLELNKKLEGLYENKKMAITDICDEKPTIAFSDSNIGRNSIGINNSYQNYTKDETQSTLNNKEVYKMSNYYGEGSNGVNYTGANGAVNYNTGAYNTTAPNSATCGSVENKGGIINNFATVPADQSLTHRRSLKEILFMDIPWDTKIDVWGGIKKLCSAQVKITF